MKNFLTVTEVAVEARGASHREVKFDIWLYLDADGVSDAEAHALRTIAEFFPGAKLTVKDVRRL